MTTSLPSISNPDPVDNFWGWGKGAAIVSKLLVFVRISRRMGRTLRDKVKKAHPQTQVLILYPNELGS